MFYVLHMFKSTAHCAYFSFNFFPVHNMSQHLHLTYAFCFVQYWKKGLLCVYVRCNCDCKIVSHLVRRKCLLAAFTFYLPSYSQWKTQHAGHVQRIDRTNKRRREKHTHIQFESACCRIVRSTFGFFKFIAFSVKSSA